MPSVANFAVTEFTVAGPENVGVMDYAVVDINGDGFDDVLVTYFHWPMLDQAIPMTILLGSADGTLTQAPADFITGGLPENVWGRQIVVADFNNDGRPDFYVADHGYDAAPFPGAQNTLVLSTPGGGFVNATANLPQLTDFSHSAAAGDFNGDGNIDLFVNNYNGGTEEASYLLFGDGTGAFTMSRALPADIVAGNYNSPASAAYDVDGDGDLDLILTPNFTDEQDVRILLNNGSGDFSIAETSIDISPIGVHDAVVDVAIGDVTGDGLPDMIFSIAVDNYASGGQLAIFVNQGNGQFVDETAARVADPSTANWTLRNQLIDLNNDGFVDIVQVISGGANDGPILLNDGNGNFVRLPADYSSGYDSFTGAFEYDRPFAGDFNGDGLTDLATSRYNDGGTQFWAVHLAIDPGTSQSGNAAANALMGDGSDETLAGGNGDDVIFAGAGDDLLDGGAGADVLNGGAGADTASYAGAGSAVTVSLANLAAQNTGGAGVDTLSSIEGLIGSGFGDVLTGSAAANDLYGRGGNDTLTGNGGDDLLEGGAGDDRIDGGAGSDTAFYSEAAVGVVVSVATSAAQNTLGAGTDTLVGIENLTGSASADRLTGNSRGNVLIGLTGNDLLIGDAGVDELDGGEGSDIYVIATATDHPAAEIRDTGSGGTDEVRFSVTGSTAQTLTLFAGDTCIEHVVIGTGTGTTASTTGLTGHHVDARALGNAVAITGNSGANTIFSTAFADALSGGNGEDRFYAYGGDDTIDGGRDRDVMYGGAGDDTYVVDHISDAPIEQAGEGTDTVFASVAHTLKANVEHLEMTGIYSIHATGNALDNMITGNSGANRMWGEGGSDTLIGGEGYDQLDGGAGNDTLVGGLGNDIYFVDSAGDATIEGLDEGRDTVRTSISWTLGNNMDWLELQGSGDVDGTGNSLANVLKGNDGANILVSLDGNDKIYAGLGNDTVNGGAGNDWLEGEAGTDSYFGGTGSDRFVFRDGDFGGATPDTADVIWDFSQAERDLIRLDLVDADTTLDGRQDFTFIGTGAFTGTAGELRYQHVDMSDYSDLQTWIYGDTDGDGSADFMIRIDGLHNLSEGDFIC